MLSFYLANKFDEAVSIPENLHSYLQRNAAAYPNLNLDIIIELPMYGVEKIFSSADLHDLVALSKGMIRATSSSQNKKLNTFFKDLTFLCEKALNSNKSIIAIAD